MIERGFVAHKIRPSQLRQGDEIVFEHDVLVITECHPASDSSVIYGNLIQEKVPADERCKGASRRLQKRVRLEIPELNINFWPWHPDSVWREGAMIEMRVVDPLADLTMTNPDASQPLRERVEKLEAFVAKMAKGEHSLVKYYDLSEEAESLLKESDHA